MRDKTTMWQWMLVASALAVATSAEASRDILIAQGPGNEKKSKSVGAQPTSKDPPKFADWADNRAHDKGCHGPERIFHVRCERPDGNWSDRCTDMPLQPFRRVPMTKAPVRLADKAWTEVAILDPACRR